VLFRSSPPGLGEATNGVNLLHEYCSDPLPEIRNRKTDRGRLVTEIVNQDVGTSVAFTGFLCDLYRKADVRWQDTENSEIALCSEILYPVEVNVCDAFIRKGTYGDGLLGFRSESWNMVGQREAKDSGFDVLFADNAVEHLGRGVESLHSTEYPQYVEMISHVMERLGWDPKEFDAYRHRLVYPVMPSAVVCRADLPEKPE